MDYDMTASLFISLHKQHNIPAELGSSQRGLIDCPYICLYITLTSKK